MDESQILKRLHVIEAEIAAGLPPKAVYESILEAVQALGFERARLDLLSPDGLSIAPASSRGFDGDGLSGPIPASDDPDLAKLFGNPCPQVAGDDGCEAEGDATGERGFVPLVLRGMVIGKITVDNVPSSRQVSLSEVKRVALFAPQAAIAQAMIWAGSLESLQQTTLAITSERDPRTLLNTIIEQAVKLLGAKSGGIYEHRPELGELTVIADFKRPYEGQTLKLGEGMAGRVVQDHLSHLWVPNYNDWEGRADIYGGDRSFGAVLEVPLRWEERYIGVLYVDDEVGRTFSDADIYLLRLFADQAAICLANSNLLQENSKKLQRLEQLARATQEMIGNLDAIPLRNRLDMIARHAAHILGAETSGVFLVHGEELVLEASFGQREGFEPGIMPPLKIHNRPSGGLTGYIAYHGIPYKEHGEALKEHIAVKHSAPHSPSGDCYSLLALPLMKHLGQGLELVGLIRADNKKGESDRALDTLGFSQEDEWVLTIFAEAAMVAIEGAALVSSLKEQGDFRERLISSSPAGIIAVDRQGRVTEFNKRAEEILGYTRDEVLNKPVSPLYLDKKEPRRIGKLLHEKLDHHVRDYETYIRSKEGEAIPIRHSSTWLLDAAAERVGSVGYFVDLRAQRELERGERLLLDAGKALAEAAKLDDGLQRIADMMVSKLGCSFCGILLMDEDGKALTLRAENLTGEPDRRSHGRQIVLPEWEGLSELLNRGRPWQRERSDLRSQPILERLADLLGFERQIDVLLVVPLKIGDRVVGQLDLGNLAGEKRASFSEKEIELVSALAAQITGLIQRFQLLETTIRREELLKALVQASPHIQAGAEIKVLQQVIVRLASELVGCPIGGLLLNRSYLGQLELAAVYGAPEELIGEHLSHEEGLIGTVARAGETALSLNPGGNLFKDLGLKAVAVVPFRRGSGEVEAVLFVGDSRPRNPFSRIDLEVLDAFAAQATIALDTARLMDREQLYGRQMATLHRISDYIQGANSLEEILHSVLTGITASYGLGFNRAVLMLVDETGDYLVGQMGIGELEDDKAHEAWESAAEVDDFERYLRCRERGQIPETTVGRRIRSLRLPIREGGVFFEVLENGKYQHVPAKQFDRVPKPFLKLIQAKTPLEVAPLTANGQAIGILIADNKFTQTPVGEGLSNALMTFASTAAVAIENKRLFDQTRSGAEKLLSFYKMSSELIALSEPREILTKIVAQTVAVSGASWVSIVLIDNTGRAINAIESSSHISREQNATLLIRPEGISMQVRNTGQVFPIENVAKMRDRVNPKLMRRSVQAAICLPMSLPGKRIGVMWIHYDEPHRFPESEVAALQLYVNQAAIAYESSRRTETLEDMRATSTALAEVDDMRSLLDRMVQGAQRVLKADEAVIWLYDAKTDGFIPESSTYAGDHPGSWSDLQKSGPRQRGTAFQIMDLTWMCAEDIQDPAQSEQVGPRTRQFLQEIGGRGFQGAALKVGREKLGVLYAIYLKPCRFEEEEREAALTFANYAALALKKAKLLDQVQRAREAAEVVARVTLLEDPKHTLLSIVQETKRALDCGAVILYQYDEDAGVLIQPTTVTGVTPLEEETGPDHCLILAMIEHERPYIVQDIAHDERFRDSPFARNQGIKSFVAVPLKAAGRKVGVMFVNYRNPRRFTADELTNIELFANQSAVAIRNIQLFEESATKLKQQETLAELSRELLLAKSVQETMDSAVKFAARVLDTEFSNIVLPDRGGRLLFSAAVGWEQEMVGIFVLDHGEGSQTGYTIRKRAPVAVYDYAKETRFTVPPTVFEHNLHSGLSAPMFREGEIVGAMLVHTRQPIRFNEDDGTLLRLIADQTAIALDRAQQYEAIVRKSSYLAALYEVSKAITTQFGLERQQILGQIIQPAMEGIVGLQGPKATLGTIQLYDEFRDELILESVYPPDRYQSLVERIGERRSLRGNLTSGERIGITGRTVLTGQPQIVSDVNSNDDYIEFDHATFSELTVPLFDLTKVIGVLNVESDHPAAFDREDQEALQTLAELAVIAIQNARRVEALRTQTTLAWMGLGNAVGRHDFNTQIGILKAKLFLLEKAVKAEELSLSKVDELIRDIEDISIKLQNLGVDSPAGQANEELSSIFVKEELIERYEKRFSESHPGRKQHIVINCEIDAETRIRANLDWLFRVLDILVNNATQAAARTIALGSRRSSRKDWIEIYVADDGEGIPERVKESLLHKPIREGAKGLGTGLLIAQEAVRIYGGAIHWEERNPRGTTMVLSLPIETARLEEETVD